MSAVDIGAVCHLIRKGQIPALSVRQPWTYRIMYRGKDIENRTWETKYRGWVMIHAGKAYDRDALRDCFSTPNDPIGDPALMPLGAIMGIVKIAGAVRDDPSPWFVGPVGLILRHPIRLPTPVPCSGKLGLFKPGGPEREKVIAELLSKARQRKSM